MENVLDYGYNLDILRQYIPDKSAKPIYLDTPFNSDQNYNILFQPEKLGAFKEKLIQVKAGNTSTAHVRYLGDVVQREKAAVSIIISMETPAKPIKIEDAPAGFYESRFWGKKYPKIQLLTIEELLNDKMIEMPPIRQAGATFKRAQRHETEQGEQLEIREPDSKED